VPKPQDDDLVMNLVELALRQPPDTREAYLRSACAGDEELFRQVWDYVQWDGRMKNFLLDPLCPALSEHRFVPGDLLADRFRIVREVAQGGMGIVYEAVDERLGRRIALKCAKSAFRRRLPPEVRHASEITHPNVCRTFEIHTASTSGGEIDFLTMEFLEGETLAGRLGRGPLPETEARTIARQICAGLAEAHRNRVVHGDLKSNNVILSRDAGGGVRAVITDFGLARSPMGPPEDIAAGALGSSEAGGTPDYMAPELWKGEKQSAASDIYAFGVILYELVAGRRPWAPETRRQESPNHKPPEETTSTVSTVSLETPSSSQDRGKRKPPAVQHEWNWLLQRCLDPDPAKRFQDAVEVAATLEPARSRRWWIGAVAAVVLAAAVWAVTYQRATAPKESLRLAMLPFRSSPDTADLAAGLSRDTAARLARLRGNSRAKAVFIRESDVAGKNVDTIAKARSVLSATHVLQTTIEKENGDDILRAYLTDVRSGENKKVFELHYKPEQLRYAPGALAGIVTSSLRLPPISPRTTVNAAAQQDYLIGLSWVTSGVRLDDSIAALQRAVTADPDSPLTWAGLAQAQWLKYDRTGEVGWKEKAQESVRQAELRDPDLPEVHLISGWLKKNSSQYESAEADFQRVIELQPGNGDAWLRLGMTYRSSGLLSEALTALQKAAQVRPDDFKNHLALGDFYREQGKYPDSLVEFQKAEKLAPNLSDTHYNLGMAFLDQRKVSDAESELRTAISIEPRNSDAVQVLAVILSDKGKYREAAVLYLRAIEIGPRTSLLWLNLGRCYSGQGLKRLATDAFSQGLILAVRDVEEDTRNGRKRAYLAYLEAKLHKENAELDIVNALQLSQDDTTHWLALFTYEELGGGEHRAQAVNLLARFPSMLAEVKYFPELADLGRDPRYLKLLSSNHIQ